MVIYLFNVRYMPEGVAVFKVAVSFWNLATLGLIVSSVAGRFAFTAVGSEGKAYFASRVLPLEVWPYLWAKYLFTAVPLSALSALTLYGSNRFLGVEGKALAYSVFLAVASALALSALALCMGSAQPIFDARNPAKAVMSAWGLGYMFLSLAVCVRHPGVLRPPRLPVLQAPPRPGPGGRLRAPGSQCGRTERHRSPGLPSHGGTALEADGGKVRKARREKREQEAKGERRTKREECCVDPRCAQVIR